jgi:hypothetical protein
MRPEATTLRTKSRGDDPERPYLVVYFGILDYGILSEHATRAEARAALREVQRAARTTRLAVPYYTRDAQPHDFDVRTQAQLDELVRAIHATY